MKQSVWRVLLAAACWFSLPSDAQACVCASSEKQPSHAEAVRAVQGQFSDALAVFVGEPVGGNTLTVRFRVQSVWKGELGTEVTMATGAEPTSDGLIQISSCDYHFRQGQAYLVFAFGKTLETMKAHACTFTSALQYTEVPKTLDEIARRRRPLAFITPRRLVAVIGSVRHPGVIEWREGMTVADAIKLAGGAVTPARKDVAEARSKIVRSRITREEHAALPTSVLLADDELFVGGDMDSGSQP
jgi:hypothetical protein